MRFSITAVGGTAMMAILLCLSLAGEVNLDSGLKIHYQTWGDEGPVVLLIAGWGNRLEIWEPLAEKLEASYRLVAFDARGIGRSGDSEAPYSTASMADEAAGLMEKLGFDHYHVAGISLGSFVAQKLAAKYSTRVERLVLIATSLGGAEHVPPEQEVLGFFMRAGTMEPEPLAREGIQLALHPEYYAAHPEEIEAMVQARVAHPTSQKTLLRQAQAAMMSDHGQNAREIETPTLVIHGGADRLVPIANGRKTHEALPNSQFMTIDKSGHVSIVDQTAAVAKAMSEFLD